MSTSIGTVRSTPDALSESGHSLLVPALQRVFASAAVALLAITLSVTGLYAAYHASAQWVVHTREVARVARELHSSTLRWDAAVHAYHSAESGDALARALAAREQAYANLDSLSRLTIDNDAQQEKARDLRELLVRWDQTFASRSLAGAVTEGGRADVLREGFRLLDAVQSAEVALTATEERLYLERLRRAAGWQYLMIGTVIVEISVVAILIFRLRRRLIGEAIRDGTQQERLEEQAIELESQTEELEVMNSELMDVAAEAEEHRAEAEQAVAEQQALISAMTDVIIVFDGNGTYIKIEPTAPGLLSRPAEELVGKTVFDTFPEPRAREMLAVFRQAIETGRPVRHEYEVVIGGRPIAFSGTASPLGRDRVLCVARDITDARAAEAQLRQAQKMEAVGRLAGGIAHDFNNMLAVILSYGSMLAEEISQDDQKYDDIQEINGAAQRAAALTRQLLTFSRQQVLQPTVMDLNQAVSAVENMLRRLTTSTIDFRIELNPLKGFVRADPGQIDQVLVNLAVNASDAMPRGGTLTITTSEVELGDVDARRYGVRQPGAYVVLSVSDTGVGMSAEVQSQIFEPFFTTKDVGHGTGLGLATVYGIVQQSDGAVWVQSELGSGTTFKVFLPLLSKDDESEEPAAVASTLSRGNGTVLVVEDEDAVRKVALRVLARAGYLVLEARNGVEAAELIRASTATVDLVLTDMLMPGLGGRELAQIVWAQREDARILFMSGYAKDTLVPDDLLRPGVGFLQKPFSSSVLLHRVGQMMMHST